MKRFKLVFAMVMFSFSAHGHHYKGLPHFSYFENYPQIPYLEFIHEHQDFEIFITVYNFQGLNLDMVESPDDVRLYIYIYNLAADKVSQSPARFRVFSRGNIIHDTGVIPPEQESIFIIQKAIRDQDDLLLKVDFKNLSGDPISMSIPFQITETVWQQYGVYFAIVVFFAIVIMLKLIINQVQSNRGGQVVVDRT